MNKKALIPSIVLAVSVMVMFSAAAFSNDWFDDYNTKEMQPQPVGPEDGVLSENSISYALFEENGPILLVLAVLMFGAIIGGVYIAREDDEDDTD